MRSRHRKPSSREFSIRASRLAAASPPPPRGYPKPQQTDQQLVPQRPGAPSIASNSLNDDIRHRLALRRPRLLSGTCRSAGGSLIHATRGLPSLDNLVQKNSSPTPRPTPATASAIKAADRFQVPISTLPGSNCPTTATTRPRHRTRSSHESGSCPEPLRPSDQVIALPDPDIAVRPLRERDAYCRVVLSARPFRQAQPPQTHRTARPPRSPHQAPSRYASTARQHHLLTTESHRASPARRRTDTRRNAGPLSNRATKGTRQPRPRAETIANPMPVISIATLSICRDGDTERMAKSPALTFKPRGAARTEPRSALRRGCDPRGAAIGACRSPVRS